MQNLARKRSDNIQIWKIMMRYRFFFFFNMGLEYEKLMEMIKIALDMIQKANIR